MKGVTRDLFSPPLRRVKHDGRYATVFYNPPADAPDAKPRRDGRPPKRRRYGSRLNSGDLWAQAAWAELAGLEPVISYRTHTGIERTERPWRDWDAALAYLHAMAAAPVGRGAARQRLDNLVRRGLLTEDEAYPSAPGGTVER